MENGKNLSEIFFSKTEELKCLNQLSDQEKEEVILKLHKDGLIRCGFFVSQTKEG